jgi:hypothetical protein
MAKNVIKKPQTSLKMRQARAGSIQRKAGGQEAHTHEAKHPPAKTEPALKTQARKQKNTSPKTRKKNTEQQPPALQNFNDQSKLPDPTPIRKISTGQYSNNPNSISKKSP